MGLRDAPAQGSRLNKRASGYGLEDFPAGRGVVSAEGGLFGGCGLPRLEAGVASAGLFWGGRVAPVQGSRLNNRAEVRDSRSAHGERKLGPSAGVEAGVLGLEWVGLEQGDPLFESHQVPKHGNLGETEAEQADPGTLMDSQIYVNETQGGGHGEE